MGTATATAYRVEGRALGSQAYHRYATGSISVKYLLPTANTHPVTLRVQVIEIKGRKATLHCGTRSQGKETAEV